MKLDGLKQGEVFEICFEEINAYGNEIEGDGGPEAVELEGKLGSDIEEDIDYQAA